MNEILLMLAKRCALAAGLFFCCLSYAHADTAVVRMATTSGEILVELEPEKAPATVANFLQYVEDGFYDGTIFHRVIEGFMIQGGGFTSDYQRKTTRSAIRNEADNGLRNHAYSIAMARTNAPHSATAQFFINTVDNPNLDHTQPTDRGWGYTVFGRVIAGHEVVDLISQVPTGRGGPFSRDAPRLPIEIKSIEILDSDDTGAVLGPANNSASIDDGTVQPEKP